MSNSYIQELQPLFKIDPLLLRLFVKVTALEEISLLIGKVPTSILLVRLAEECTQENQVIYQFLYCVYVFMCLLIPMHNHNKVLNKNFVCIMLSV